MGDEVRNAELIQAFRAGRIRALARAITMVERRDPALSELTDALVERTRAAHVIGLTGAPGTGKSTLVDALVATLRVRDQRVAVIAVDPNSPYSGGALLGDRIRMQRHALDPGVYIRSMGARGHLGGLAIATREVIRLLGAFGFDQVLIETVGVGQSELEVARVADTTVVVLAPGLGDGVQMIKAGIMEIGDIFVVNKADLPAAQHTIKEIRMMLHNGPAVAWQPPIVPTVATGPQGLEELWAAVHAHREHQGASGEADHRAEQRLREETADLVGAWGRERAMALLEARPELVARLLSHRSPHAVMERIVDIIRS